MTKPTHEFSLEGSTHFEQHQDRCCSHTTRPAWYALSSPTIRLRPFLPVYVDRRQAANDDPGATHVLSCNHMRSNEMQIPTRLQSSYAPHMMFPGATALYFRYPLPLFDAPQLAYLVPTYEEFELLKQYYQIR